MFPRHSIRWEAMSASTVSLTMTVQEWKQYSKIRKEYDATRYIRDASQIYSGCKDLNEYLQK